MAIYELQTELRPSNNYLRYSGKSCSDLNSESDKSFRIITTLRRVPPKWPVFITSGYYEVTSFEILHSEVP